MSILSIQSHVSYGYVGNRAATFPLQSLGYDVWAVNTVNFSNHTGYGKWAGQVLAPEHVRDVIHGIWDRDVTKQCQAILSGYVGDPAVGAVILEAATHVKKHKPDALYLCDPVMGDVGRGFFVREGILDFFKSHGLPAADIITPNHFEAEALWGRPITTLEEAKQACMDLSASGPHTIAITSIEVPIEGIEPHQICTYLFHKGATWLGHTPREVFDIAPNGTGDLFSALFLGHFLATRDPASALEATLQSVYDVIHQTAVAGERELRLLGHAYGSSAKHGGVGVRRV
jgi:pyridoxine kinase